jgi:hypothetical protein
LTSVIVEPEHFPWCGNEAVSFPRRWFHFSLRGLLGLVVVAAGGSWWLHAQVEQGKLEQRVLSELRPLGVYADVSEPRTLGRFVRGMSPQMYQWCRKMLGQHTLSQASSLSIDRSLDDQDFGQIVQHARMLPGLKEMSISDMALEYEPRFEQALPHVAVTVLYSECGGCFE